ncbi:MAG: class I tRNA ligase family protein [Desulfobulbaceae bacterium]|nr:class I tRNA ligase family protein [Desulfobulbaceae bacterium]
MGSGNKRIKNNTLYLRNTLSRRLDPFIPADRKLVRMFTCGPSIYDRPHIGNYRTYIYEDILERYLNYLGCRVKRVINFTDVEDKSIARMEKQGASLAEVTEPNAALFRKEAHDLHIRLPTYIPRSSTTVDQAVKLIQILLKKKIAYRHGRDIFYDPLKFEGFGKLFGLDMSKWPTQKRRFARDTYPGQRWNLGDFILWHGYRRNWGGSLCWDMEIGKGRPAWNIQDPAMITAHLGYQIDISCGGVDNLYRHHDYTIAVIEAVSRKQFARYWLHGEHVLIDGKKMSKSKGNILYPGDLVDRGYNHGHIRFHLLRTHYRRRITLRETELAESREQLDNLQIQIQKVLDPTLYVKNDSAKFRNLLAALRNGFTQAMNNDLDSGAAISNLGNTINLLVQFKDQQGINKKQAASFRQVLTGIDSVLKVFNF